jgi:transcriptional regulator with XRE-family HTH domain
MNVGEKIRMLRKNASLTQKELASKSGIAEITIRKYENQERQPTLEMLFKLSKAFNISYDELLGWEDMTNGIRTSSGFEEYLKTLGYSVEVEKVDESKEGHHEDMIDENGQVISQAWIPDEEFFSVTLEKDGIRTEFTGEQFNQFQTSIENAIAFEIFKQKNK